MPGMSLRYSLHPASNSSADSGLAGSVQKITTCENMAAGYRATGPRGSVRTGRAACRERGHSCPLGVVLGKQLAGGGDAPAVGGCLARAAGWKTRPPGDVAGSADFPVRFVHHL